MPVPVEYMYMHVTVANKADVIGMVWAFDLEQLAIACVVARSERPRA